MSCMSSCRFSAEDNFEAKGWSVEIEADIRRPLGKGQGQYIEAQYLQLPRQRYTQRDSNCIMDTHSVEVISP